MSGSEAYRGPRGVGRGAALALVFASVLAAGAATNSLPRGEEKTSGAAARPVAATVDRDEMTRAAAKAMADGESATEAAEEVVSRSGDRWGAVYDKREYEEFRQALDGEYTGVGLSARRTAGGLIEVTRVQPGGPAATAGIGPGDTVRSVDGTGVAKRPVTEVMALLRGDKAGGGTGTAGAGTSTTGTGTTGTGTTGTGATGTGTPDTGTGSTGASGDTGGERDTVGRKASTVGTRVVLGLERDGHHWTRTLRRARLSTESVTVDPIAGGARQIKVNAFTKGSGERVREAVLDAPPGAGVLLDLRGNAGGLVDEAVTAASAFLDGGLVATYDIRGEQRALYAEQGGDTARPVVVLVDGGTMSAAELLTGALQDRGRSVTVGSPTFGKGSVQMPSELPDGSVAELTVGHYRTPAGHGVDGEGVTPDLVAGRGAQERAKTVLSGLGGGASGTAPE
ncbi:S41 family peptidase [Streptomyces corynorhini]|uniref:PDZ domain-containing protein n=1 Tax=Streptomyces corynorhini TaxID=2282652 RepID=A0A370BAM5_9ACTN|nr:S41 family peptidase [Streptomyces corynorhini]RDG38681.1 PDZ domain-containing protein [Streptomyces corynorhini]